MIYLVASANPSVLILMTLLQVTDRVSVSKWHRIFLQAPLMETSL